MKLLFVSDLQLEAGLALGSGEYGPGSRFADQQHTLTQLIDAAVGQNVDLVCVLGDVFERSKPSPWAVLAMQDFVRALTAAGISVLMIPGNHDYKTASMPPMLTVYKSSRAHVMLAPDIEPYRDVVVVALPWTPLSSLVAAKPGMSRGELIDLAGHALTFRADELVERARKEYPGLQVVLVGHWAITGASLPTGLGTDMLGEVVLSLDHLASMDIDVAAFGHIHMAQVLSEKPPIAYCGSPMVMNWGEAHVPHGYWLYDTDGSLSFAELHDRKFLTLELSSLDMVNAEWEQWDLSGAFVRLRWEMDEDVARTFDQNGLRHELLTQGARKVFLQPRIIRKTRVRVDDMDDTLDPERAFELWLATQEGEDADALREAHSDYLRGLNEH